MATDASPSPLAVGVLGPFRVAVDGVPADIPGAKRRAVLALLVLAAGHPVSVDDIVDALWPTDPPEKARAALHSHIFRLRRHLGPLASRLEALEGGYRLRLEEGELDLHRAARAAGPGAGPSAHRRSRRVRAAAGGAAAVAGQTPRRAGRRPARRSESTGPRGASPPDRRPPRRVLAGRGTPRRSSAWRPRP